MIIDQLQNSGRYATLNGNFAKAFEFIRRFEEGESLASGRHEIDGDAVYALVQSYETLPAEQKKWEAHRRYIDVQYVASGRETMGWAPLGTLGQKGEYLSEKDFQGYEDGPATVLRSEAGMFAIFFPEDIHRPGCQLEGPCAVRKIVVKIKV